MGKIVTNVFESGSGGRRSTPMKLPGAFWERPIVLALIIPGGFVAGLLVAPVLYFLTYGDLWKSLGSTLIGFATMGVVFGSLFGFVDLLGWIGQRPRRQPLNRARMRKWVLRRPSSNRVAA